MTEKQYGKLVSDMSPKSPMGKDCFNAFWIGGLICALGQAFMNGYAWLGLEREAAGTAATLAPVPRVLSSSCGTCVFYEGEEPLLERMDADTEAVYRRDGDGNYVCLMRNE